MATQAPECKELHVHNLNIRACEDSPRQGERKSARLPALRACLFATSHRPIFLVPAESYD